MKKEIMNNERKERETGRKEKKEMKWNERKKGNEERSNK